MAKHKTLKPKPKQTLKEQLWNLLLWLSQRLSCLIVIIVVVHPPVTPTLPGGIA